MQITCHDVFLVGFINNGKADRYIQFDSVVRFLNCNIIISFLFVYAPESIMILKESFRTVLSGEDTIINPFYAEPD